MNGKRLMVGMTVVLTCIAGLVAGVVGQTGEGPPLPPVLESRPPELPSEPAPKPFPKVFPAERPESSTVRPVVLNEDELSAPLPPPPPARSLPPVKRPPVKSMPVEPKKPAFTPESSKASFPTPTPQVFDTSVVPSANAPGVPGRLEGANSREAPAVSLEWVVPPTTKVGQPSNLQLVVKNISTSPVQQVVVRCRLPEGVKINAIEPRPIMEENLLMWNIGGLNAQQERRLELSLMAESRGEITCPAWVTFTGASTARLVVREPKLVVKAMGPEKVLLGDTATFEMKIHNPGDGQADKVRLEVHLPEGLESKRGRTVEVDVGNLEAGGSRTVQLVCATKQGGEQKLDVVALGDVSLTAQDQFALNITEPKLDIQVIGPKLRYLERPASFVFKVTNPGTALASNVTVTDQIPQGFKFVGASEGGRHDTATRTVSWFVGDLAPGQSREVKLDVLATTAGEQRHKASAFASRGLKKETDMSTRVEGISAILMELVDVDDPVEVGADTTYEIRVTNTGSKTETNLQLSCMLPEKMEYRGANGVNGCRHRVEGQHIVFEPLPKLAPRADAVYRVQVRGTAQGDLRFRARITADGLNDPVHKEESTRVYGDEAVSQ